MVDCNEFDDCEAQISFLHLKEMENALENQAKLQMERDTVRES